MTLIGVAVGAIVPTTGLVAVILKWQSDKTAAEIDKNKLQIETNRLRIEAERVANERATAEGSQDAEFRRDLLALQERLQQTVERQQKELAANAEKMESVRQRSHKLQEDSNKLVNALQEQVLHLTEQLGDLRAQHEHDMKVVELAAKDESAECRRQLVVMQAEINRLKLDLEKCLPYLPHPTESVPGEWGDQPPPEIVVPPFNPEDGC